MTAPAPYRTLIEAISARKNRAPQGLAFVFLSEDGREQKVSNEIFYGEMKRFAAGLTAKGIRQGDIVLLALDHGIALINCFWGAVCCGAIPSIMPYWRHGSDKDVYARKIQRLAAAVRASAVVTLSDLYSAMTSALTNTGSRVFTIQEIIAVPDHVDVIFPESGSDHIAFLQFTSGTTSEPKAIQFTHKAVLDNVASSAQAAQVNGDTVYVSWLPFYHDMGLITGHLRSLIHEGLLVSMSPQAWLRKPEMLLHAVHRYHGTMTYMPNFGFEYCTQMIREEEISGVDLSSWRILSNGSEPVSSSSMRRFNDRFAPYGFCSRSLAVGYGMAENICGISESVPGTGLHVDWISANILHDQNQACPVEPCSAGAREIVSCGYPYQGVDLKILNDQGDALPDRGVGEIAIRSNTLFAGYYLQAETDETLIRDGWFRTGDVGYMADGQLYVCDRKKDLIIVGGRNVQPQAIENIAAGVFGSSVGRMAAFGVSDESLGTEQPVLVMELRNRLGDAEERRLIDKLRHQVSDELDIALADVCIVSKGWVVKTTSGKVARAASRDKYLAEGHRQQAEESAGLPADLTPEKIHQILTGLFEKVIGIRGIGLNDDFVSRGGDSLSALRLLLEIEKRFGQEVTPAEFFNNPTVEKVTLILFRKMKEQSAAENGSPVKRKIETPSHESLKPERPGFFRDGLKKIHEELEQKIADIIYILFLTGRRLYGKTWERQTFNLKKVRLMREFYSSLNHPVQTETEAVECCLLCNAPKSIQKKINRRAFLYWPGNWTLQVDMDALKRAYQKGKGVIIVGRHSRSWLNRLAGGLVTEQLNPDGFTIIGQKKQFFPQDKKKLSKEQRKRWTLKIFLDQIMQSKSLLQKGGMIMILPDGKGGMSGRITASLHGRIHGFRAGFANLAVETGAAVIPFSTTIDVHRKQITVFFSGPFDAGTPEMDDAERIKKLVGQYAVFLEQEWARCPGLVPFDQMTKHLKLPLCDVTGYSRAIEDPSDRTGRVKTQDGPPGRLSAGN